MQTTNAACLGLYEKALPADLSWPQRLATAAELGFEFVEMSIDEQPARQQRLDWDRRQRLAFIEARLDSGVTVPSLCLSAHRRDPFGSADAATRERARVLMSKALELATDLGIRNIQLAGYDVYYEPADRHSRALYRGHAVGGGAGRQGAGDAVGGGDGHAVHQQHQQMA